MSRIKKNLGKSIAELEGWKWQGEIPGPESSGLARRFYKLHDTKIEDLTSEDIDLYVEQEYGLKYVVPLALDILKKDVLFGSDYPGSLLGNLLHVNGEYWANNKSQMVELKDLFLTNVEKIRDLASTDDILDYINEGFDMLGSLDSPT